MLGSVLPTTPIKHSKPYRKLLFYLHFSPPVSHDVLHAQPIVFITVSTPCSVTRFTLYLNHSKGVLNMSIERLRVMSVIGVLILAGSIAKMMLPVMSAGMPVA